MSNSTQIIDFNGTPCVKLQAGGYEALVAYDRLKRHKTS